MKLFRSSNTEVKAECQRYFGFSLPSEQQQTDICMRRHIFIDFIASSKIIDIKF